MHKFCNVCEGADAGGPSIQDWLTGHGTCPVCNNTNPPDQVLIAPYIPVVTPAASGGGMDVDSDGDDGTSSVAGSADSATGVAVVAAAVADAPSCSICLLDFERGDVVVTLPCLDRFHDACVGQWFAGKKTCPVCRTNVADAISAMRSAGGGVGGGGGGGGAVAASAAAASSSRGGSSRRQRRQAQRCVESSFIFSIYCITTYFTIIMR